MHGGAGGIGSFAIQLAAQLGARVFTTAGSEEKRDFCRSLGAEVAIDYRDEDFVEVVKEHTDGAGADVILDNMGASYLERNVTALATEGRLVVIGMQGGTRGELDLNALLRKRGAIIATTLRARPAEEKAAICASVVEHVWPLVADGQGPAGSCTGPCPSTTYAARTSSWSPARTPGRSCSSCDRGRWTWLHDRPANSRCARSAQRARTSGAPESMSDAAGDGRGAGEERRATGRDHRAGRPADRRGPGVRPAGGAAAGDDDPQERSVTDLVEQPAKVMRIGSMIRQLLEEVKSAPLDEASRNRLKEIHQASIHELEAGLAPELVEELERLTLPFSDDQTPSEGELRIAQAQLVGWLEGLFHGIQTAIYAQQMAAGCSSSRCAAGCRWARAASTQQEGPDEAAAPARRLRRDVPLRSLSATDGSRRAPRAGRAGPTSTRAAPGAAARDERLRLAGVDRGEHRLSRAPGRSAARPRRADLLDLRDHRRRCWVRVPLVPEAIHGSPVPVTKNMYSVSDGQRAEAALGLVAVGLHLDGLGRDLALVDEVDGHGLEVERAGHARRCAAGARRAVTVPLKTAIAALVLSWTVTGGHTGARFGLVAACVGAPSASTVRADHDAREQARQQAAEHRSITTDHSSKMPASTWATPSSSLLGATWSTAASTLGCALAMAYDVPAHASIGRSLGMSPKATTSAGSTPSRSARPAPASVALVTPGGADLEQRAGRGPRDRHPVADRRLGRVPVVVRRELLVPGEQLDHGTVDQLLERRPPGAVGGTGCRSWNSGSRPMPDRVSTANAEPGTAARSVDADGAHGLGVDLAAQPRPVRRRRPTPARRWRRRPSPWSPTWSKTSSAQRSGRPVTKTTGTPLRLDRGQHRRGCARRWCRRSGPASRRGRWRPAAAGSPGLTAAGGP